MLFFFLCVRFKLIEQHFLDQCFFISKSKFVSVCETVIFIRACEVCEP